MSCGSRSALLFTLVSLLAGVVASNGCALPKDRQQAYGVAVEAQQRGQDARVIAAAELYLQGTAPDDARYDRALMLIARACEQLGLSYAASVLYREVASAGRNMELLPAALRGLERIVRTGRFDEDQILEGFLAGSEFSGMPDGVQAFLAYSQGLDSIRRGFDRWGDEQFSRIPLESDYHWRAAYVWAVRAIASDQVEQARELLEWMLAQEASDSSRQALVWLDQRVIKSPVRTRLPRDLKIEIRRTLARLAFGERRFQEALEQYEAIRELAPQDPEILLEQAWTHFYLGDSRRALGRLIALDAPIHRSYIAPERYVLEAFSLRRICQFAPARQAAVRLWERHGDALKDLMDGVPVERSEALRRAARRRQGARSAAQYLWQLKRERREVERRSHRFGPHALRRLTLIYDRGIEEAEIREAAALEKETRALAAELLDAEEGVRLAVHELSVSLLRGRRRPSGPPERPAEPLSVSGTRVFFDFVGEFWTDELDELVVQAEDRCID